MIWEVDENLDEMVDFDEFQLTYYRNIIDTTGNEPNMFFKILEVLILNMLVLRVAFTLLTLAPRTCCTCSSTSS